MFTFQSLSPLHSTPSRTSSWLFKAFQEGAAGGGGSWVETCGCAHFVHHWGESQCPESRCGIWWRYVTSSSVAQNTWRGRMPQNPPSSPCDCPIKSRVSAFSFTRRRPFLVRDFIGLKRVNGKQAFEFREAPGSRSLRAWGKNSLNSKKSSSSRGKTTTWKSVWQHRWME